MYFRGTIFKYLKQKIWLTTKNNLINYNYIHPTIAFYVLFNKFLYFSSFKRDNDNTVPVISSPKITRIIGVPSKSLYNDLKIKRAVQMRTPVQYACTGGDVKVQVQSIGQNLQQLAAANSVSESRINDNGEMSRFVKREDLQSDKADRNQRDQQKYSGLTNYSDNWKSSGILSENSPKLRHTATGYSANTKITKRATFVKPNDFVERKMSKEILYSRPVCSYPCLIGLALKSSPSGFMCVSDIIRFVYINFPYFQKSTEQWRRHIRQNLNENTLFLTMDGEPAGGHDSGSPLQINLLWRVNPSRACEVDDAIAAWVRTDPLPKKSMFYPQQFETLVKDVMHTSNKSVFAGSSSRRKGGKSDVINSSSSEKEGENPFELVTSTLEEIETRLEEQVLSGVPRKHRAICLQESGETAISPHGVSSSTLIERRNHGSI